MIEDDWLEFAFFMDGLQSLLRDARQAYATGQTDISNQHLKEVRDRIEQRSIE